LPRCRRLSRPIITLRNVRIGSTQSSLSAIRSTNYRYVPNAEHTRLVTVTHCKNMIVIADQPTTSSDSFNGVKMKASLLYLSYRYDHINRLEIMGDSALIMINHKTATIGL